MSTAPERQAVARLLAALEPWRLLSAPRLYGLSRVPRRGPMLFVGNHTILGLLDAPILVVELLRRRRLLLRALGDHLHFQIPVWRTLLAQCGVVDGTRDACAALMRAGEAILVFPGGGREVAKRKGEKYRLIWKERIGFASLAIEHGCPIVPFAAVGAEEAWDIVVDADEMLATPLGPLVRRLGIRTDVLLPIVRGIGPTPVPRPERLYFAFAPPVDVQRFTGRHEDRDACIAVRDEVRAAVDDRIAFLLARRARDPERELGPRLIGSLRRGLLGARPRTRARARKRGSRPRIRAGTPD